jgi:tRNA A-37 threonylcarbamoyl transferase component Bud32
MTTPLHCPQCGKPLASNAPQGLCPACLLQAALPGQSTAASLLAHDLPPTNTNSPELGARLQYFGDYELIEEIARGGMGVVWKARQTSLHRTVALKMIGAGALASADEVQRFLREAEAAANLQHPNIVAIHEVGEHDGQHYFSMDYVAGRDLGALVREGPLPAQRAARYVKIIAEAIHFAHQRGTLHRDLKPQNVLIDGADQPRITDFGLAKIMEQQDSRLTQSGVVMGSPSYMPPEQAAGRHADIGPHSDVYSLGAMLYELLTGRPPFRAATAMATLLQVIEAEPTSPRRRQADVPPDLDTICLKCLEKSPTARYPSARELAEELNRFLKGEPILARPASPVRKALSWSRRHPGTLAAAAAVVVLALAFGSFYLFEENAFLRARQANPSLTRAPGLRGQSLETWDTVNLFVMVAGIFSLLVVFRRARRSTWKDMLDPASAYGPLEPIGERMRTFAACAGVVCVGSGILLLIMLIKAQVWEGDAPIGPYFQVFASVWFGLALLSYAVRDYQWAHFGVPSRQLTADQVELIRRALEEFDFPAATHMYRQAVPEAGRGEAYQYVLRLADTLRAQNPAKYVPPPLSLAAVNWPALIICVIIEVILGALAWVAFPPGEPVVFLSHFATSLLTCLSFGIGIMAGRHVKTQWKRLLIMVGPAWAVIILSQVIVPQTSADLTTSWTGWPYLVAIVCGSFLIMFAFTRRGRQSFGRT